MKKTRLFSLALAALMLGACSSEDIVVNEGDVAPGEKGFVSFSFNLPTTPSTRANDNFEDGLPVEYNVKDATLLLFAGDTEKGATFQSAYDLKLPPAENVNYNVTTRYTIIKDIEKPQSGNIYALVILNGKNSGVISNSGDSWTLNGATLSGSTTFESLYNTARSLDVTKIADTSGEGCFLMTNAPMFTAPGGAIAPDGNVQTLSVIDRDRIYGTQEEAKANPATDIYCERAVAKVTVTDGIKDKGPVSGTQIASYTFDGWTLDITSKQSYFVRNVDCTDASWWTYKADGSGDYRFVGSVGLTNTATQTLYRTYWAKDPTYATGWNSSDTVDINNFNTTINKIPTSPLTAMGGNAYCLENTFNVANQNQNQTTRVVVAAKLVVKGADQASGSFFILNDNKDVIYDSEDDIKTIVTTAYLNVPAVRQFLTTALQKGQKLENSDLNVTFSQSGAGYWDVAKIEVNESAASKFDSGVIPEELKEGNELYRNALASVNADYNIAYYAGGVSYYGARIRHFDEAQTPWTEEGKTDNSYPEPKAEENYLGRYGVLRNNWYEVNVTAIKNIGSPIPDEVYGQDDPLEKWISVRINVLSWAKRTQDVEL